MFDCPMEHPEIRCMELTGYPSWFQWNHYCEECGQLLKDEMYEDTTHDYLCRSCLLTLHEK